MNRSRLAALLLFTALALPLWAAGDSGDDLERNALLLEKWKTDPEHYARLQRDWRQFAALPREKQEKLRQFDRDLHECDSATQKRLWETLERYAAWLDQLPEPDRQQLLAIGDKQERLRAIKRKREEQWLERLPSKDRDYLQNVPEEKRPTEMAKLHQEDHRRRQKWQEALKLRPDLRPRPNKPAKLDELPPDVLAFVNDLLTPMLRFDEKEQLRKTQGWPALAQLILELSDKHPVLPPANDLGVIVKYEQLPRDFKSALPSSRSKDKLKQWETLGKHEGRWPEFPLAVTDLATRNKHLLPRTLGASKPTDFAPETEAFIRERLVPAITPVEAERLRLTEGRWPAYPKLLHELAKQYNLVIPGMSLPGPLELWASVRTAALPEVPDHELRAFAGELSRDDLHRLNLSPMDPSSRDRLRQEYFRHRPYELKRLHELDQRKNEKKRGQ